MAEKNIPDVNVVGLFIRDYILENGPSTAWEIWKAWKEHRQSIGRKYPTYQSFWRNYIYPLKRMGLLVECGSEEGEFIGTVRKKYLDVAPGHVEDDIWYNPQKALYD